MSVFQHSQLETPDSPVELWFGSIARNVVAISDKCYVILPDFAAENVLGPCYWQSRDATSLPARGDLCVVIFDNRGNLWVIAWWPYAL